jgi:hypothetical protein
MRKNSKRHGTQLENLYLTPPEESPLCFPTLSSSHDVRVLPTQLWTCYFFPALLISNGETAEGQCFYLTRPEIRQRATDVSWGLFCSALNQEYLNQRTLKLNNLQLKFLKVKKERLSIGLCFKRTVTKKIRLY